MAEALRSDFDIRVVSSANTRQPSKLWRNDDVAQVRQLDVGPFGARGLRRLLNETPHELLLLNGFHDREFTIPALLMRKLGFVPRTPVILSPRGEFAEGALSVKGARKRAFGQLVRRLGLLDDVWLHATAEHEAEHIRRQGLNCRGVLLAPNPRLLPDAPADIARERTRASLLKLAFLGRITPVKNLHFALEVLSKLKVPVQFDIFGPIDDQAYWVECMRRIATLPPNVEVRAKGALAAREVIGTLANYDIMFLPSAGENFGHAIHEALCAGVPCLISDLTPWKGLESRHAGWDIALSDEGRFVEALEKFSAADPAERRWWRLGARAFAEQSFRASEAVSATRKMFETALAEAHG
jgi:glycosyltransferase involved in cell wall biosynthesis